jgi:predicted ATPase
LEHLVPLTETVPLLICWAARPEPDPPATRLGEFVHRKHSGRHVEISLSPLPPAESAMLIDNLLDSPDLSPKLREAILCKAEGNPFFMEEVVRSLISMGAIVRDADAWRVTADVDQITIPDTLQGVIMARVDRLADDVKLVLKRASVIGRAFFYRVLQGLTKAEQQLDHHLARLQELELIRQRRRVPELEYIFKHALVQEATCESILVDRRRELHRGVAECIEAPFPDRLDDFARLLANHYARPEAWEKAQE